MGVEAGYGYGGHQHPYNQAYGGGDFIPTYENSQTTNAAQPPAFPQPTYADTNAGVEPAYNQGYAHRQGLTSSAPQSTLNGKTGFLKSKWPASFMAISALQAILCICFEAYVYSPPFTVHASLLTWSYRYVFWKFQSNLGVYINIEKVQSQYKTIPTFLTLFIFGFLYTLVVVWDALRQKNTIQVIGVCFSNLALMIYTALQIDQIREALDILQQYNGFEANVTADGLWQKMRPYLVAIPAIIALATVAMAFVTWKIYQEYAWDILKNIGADYRMKKRFLHYQVRFFVLFSLLLVLSSSNLVQIYIALLKFDFFFFLGFIIQFVVVVARKSDPEFALTIVTIPITIGILLAAAFFTRRENKPGMVAVIVLYLGGLTYFVFKLVRIYQPGFRQFYDAVRKSLTTFAVITILLILLTIANAIICMRNFGSGLKPHLQNMKRKEEKPDSITMQDVKPQNPSRMTID